MFDESCFKKGYYIVIIISTPAALRAALYQVTVEKLLIILRSRNPISLFLHLLVQSIVFHV